ARARKRIACASTSGWRKSSAKHPSSTGGVTAVTRLGRWVNPSCISGVNRGHRNVGRRAWRGCLGAHRIGGRKSADRPTPAPPLVGWSTPRVGHEVGVRCPPYRRPEQRRPPYTYAALVGRTTPRVVRRTRSRYSPIGGRKSADRPTPAPSVGWSTPRVGHQVGLRCPPYRGPEQRRPPYARAAVVDTVLPLTEQAPVRGRR